MNRQLLQLNCYVDRKSGRHSVILPAAAVKVVATLAICMMLTAVAFSHSGATGVVKERMDAMKAMGDQSKMVANMIKGKAEFNQAAVVAAADVFLAQGKRMAELFPDTELSRHGSKTEALPSVWAEWGTFNQQIEEFIKLSVSLKHVSLSAGEAGEIKKAFLEAGRSCSGCHKRYRKPRE